MAGSIRHFYEFGNVRLDVEEKVLLKGGRPVAVAPKILELLFALVENRGRIVEKDDLMARVWAGSFVEESNLTFSIRQLRKTLGDDAREPRFIETVPRRGYRFIAEVKETFPAEEKELSPPQELAQTLRPPQQAAQTLQPTPERAETLQPPRKSYLPFAAGILLLLGTISVGSWLARSDIFGRRETVPILSAPFHSEKFSTSGKVYQAALSPDGTLVAYTDESGGKYSVWLRRLETADNVQLIPPSEEFYYGLVFAHNGRSIFFVRSPLDGRTPMAVYRVSVFGGIPEKILERTEGWLSLSPDDRRISFVRCERRSDDYCSLLTADVDGKNERKVLTRPEPIRIGDNQFSPDGKSIAFADGQSWNAGSDFQLRRVDLASGAESQISPKTFFDIKKLRWLPGGGDLLLTAKENRPPGVFKIWRVSAATGEAEPLTKDAANYSAISLDKRASKIIATQFGNDFQVYFSANAGPRILVPAGEFAAYEITFAPDGKIVYSAPDGDLWTINRGGGEQRQLTNNAFQDFAPRVSPDGRFIFFTSNRSGTDQIWRTNADGSNQAQLTNREGGYPRFVTPDGKWVYYESGLRQTLWKVASDGGEEIQVSEEKMYSPAFTPDGHAVAYLFRDGGIKIGVMSLADGKLLKVYTPAEGKSWPVLAWSSDNRTLHYITRSDTKNSLWQQSLDEDRPRFVADLGDKEVQDFAIAPDGDGFAYVRGEWLHNAVLISGFK
ncbi:MAG TPA: winged helix-turn-helix domain-containing protein [Pyrinomonadaceae bacterium]|nr:winged helix-turn-helix domain-containing protein [Pyrinomonadaceae bacterium]